MSISLKIKLYGESFKIHKLQIPLEYFRKFQEVAIQLNEPLERALLNLDFFRALKIKEIQTIQDIIESTFSGLIENNKSHVEIWVGRKKVEKMRLRKLFFSETLFPLYQTNTTTLNKLKLKTGYYLEEKEIGLIGIYELKIEEKRIDYLKFQFLEFEFREINYTFLNEIYYKKEIFKFIKSDVLLQYQYCFFVE